MSTPTPLRLLIKFKFLIYLCRSERFAFSEFWDEGWTVVHPVHPSVVIWPFSGRYSAGLRRSRLPCPLGLSSTSIRAASSRLAAASS